MICATRRGVRRNAQLKLPAAERIPKATLFNFMAHAARQGKPIQDLNARRNQFDYILATVADTPVTAICGFRHPTKRATRGRYAFMTVSKVAAARPEREDEEART